LFILTGQTLQFPFLSRVFNSKIKSENDLVLSKSVS
jgi:hypothetical protein